ncbi:MAG TPA: DUF2076 domain-containing protein, partial [Hyphomicrobiaceae bacterium]|nr:DUF2076 domain-containing protein [Hyphomicrobiaceae bacterium]
MVKAAGFLPGLEIEFPHHPLPKHRRRPTSRPATTLEAPSKMTPDERQMIIGLFDRLRAAGPQDKDREAEALINQLVRQTPDGLYLLVQTALVQDFELQSAQQRIEELEQALAGRSAPASSGSFLGRGAAPASA